MNEIPQTSPVKNTETATKNPELEKIFGTIIPDTIRYFIKDLNKNEFPFQIDEKLGDSSIANRDAVVEKLHYLTDFFDEYSKNPQDFRVRVTNFDTNNETYRVNIGRGPKKSIDQEGETQVSLIYRRPTTKPETRDSDIYHASLSGNSPDRVLDKIIQQEEYSIQINSSHIYSDNHQMKIDPYAGIMFHFSQSGPSVSGLSFIGSRPSHTPLECKPLNKDNFKALTTFIRTSKVSR